MNEKEKAARLRSAQKKKKSVLFMNQKLKEKIKNEIERNGVLLPEHEHDVVTNLIEESSEKVHNSPKIQYSTYCGKSKRSTIS